MGVYAITGGSGGIGLRVISQLEKQGHETINIDWKTGDIQADLSIPEGRQKVIDELHELHPEGLDGLILCAGVPGSCHDLRLILSLNFFGTISIIKGAYDLLEKKGGSCVATVSNAISQGDLRMDLADILNNNNEDELRILDLVSNLDENDLLTGNRLYVASKYALARWVRRHSASYAANGVRINAVAPGNVNTSMTATMSVDEKTALNALPIPTKYGKETLMEPDEIASAINFLISKEARGVNGIIMFVDGGTDALLNSEKYIKYGSIFFIERKLSWNLLSRNISQLLKQKILKPWQNYLPKTATTVITAPMAHPSTNFIYMEKKPFPCFSGISFSSVSIPYYRPRS